jgi:hypothetical protein
MPQAFWAKFSTALRDRWSAEGADAYWFSVHGWPKRTEFMTDVLKKLARDFGCHCDCEYRKVDVSYFNHIAEDWSEWSCEAAIELENAGSWKNEVSKLMEINAGLKVLIAYVDDQKKLDEFWRELPKIHKSRKYVTKPCNWLFVFGFFGNSNWDFKAYTFDGESTTPITGYDPIRPIGAPSSSL